jgi:hypothetical protein
MTTIEDIILDHDGRGMTHLRPFMQADFCDDAARLIAGTSGPAMIVTGFYIIGAKLPETDGPPGALAIGRALQAMGREVVYVTDKVTHSVMRGLAGDETEVVDFPIADHEASKDYAAQLLARINPGVIIAIERCSLTADGAYLNMRGLDISEWNAKVDHLFSGHPATVGIGDGGNEIGMGNLINEIPGVDSLPNNPAATKVSKLIITSVSNWGGYGLAASLSKLAGRNLLPSLEQAADLLRRTVDLGSVDGFSTEPRYEVDGFTSEENGELLGRLHQLLAEEGITAS